MLTVSPGIGQIRLINTPATTSAASVVTTTSPGSVTPVQTRMVYIDPGAQRDLNTVTSGTRLLLDMLPGETYTAVLEHFHQNDDEPHAYVWTGSVEGEPQASFLLSTYNNVTIADLVLPSGDVYSITYNGDGTHQVSRSHPELNHFCGVESHHHVHAPAPAVQPGAVPMESGMNADAAGDVDVAIVYPTRIREINGGDDAMKAIVNMCIGYSNQAFINSGLTNFKISSAGSMELNYTSLIPEVPGGSGVIIGDREAMYIELDRLTQFDGHIDIVHELRDRIQADLVQLLLPAYPAGVVGMAWVGGSPNYGFGWSSGVLHPYSIANTVAHELGHNYGLNHDFSNDNIMGYSSEPKPFLNPSAIPVIQARAHDLANNRQRQAPTPRLYTETPSFSATASEGGFVQKPHEVMNLGKGNLNFTVTASAPWITVFPPQGSIPDFGTRSVNLEFRLDASEMGSGTHNATVTVAGPAENLNIPVTFNVTAGGPINDNFGNATELTGGFGSLISSNVNATLEPGEAAVHSGLHSVWYRWVATTADPYTIDTLGSNIDTRIGVWTGSWGALTLRGENDDIDAGIKQSRVTFTPQLGETYYIGVMASSLALEPEGQIQLNWGQNPPPANDNIANARLLSGNSGRVHGTNMFATVEPTDPAAVDGAVFGGSLWYKWTAPWNATIEFDTLDSEIDTVLGVYAGLPNALDVVGESDDHDSQLQSRVSLTVVSGTTYYIMVAGKTHDRGNIILTWTASAVAGVTGQAFPPSFWLQGHAGIDISPSYLTVRNISASPQTYTVSDDVSWMHTFTPGSLTVNPGSEVTLPIYFDTDTLPVGAYTGEIQIASSEAGSDLLIVPVTVSLLDNVLPPPNDDFINAIDITGTSGVAYTSGINATAEGYVIRGVADSNFPNSVWLRWRPQEHFPPMTQITFDSNGSGFAPPKTVIMSRHDEPVSLNMFLSSLTEPVGVPRQFLPVPDMPFYVFLTHTNNPIQVRWGINLPANDNFQGAKVITGLSGNETVETVEATRQSGEPAQIAGQEASHSVWYSWTAPSDGTIWFNTIGSDFDTLLAVYTGTWGNLNLVTENDDRTFAENGESNLSFAHTTDTTYYIRIDGVNYATGTAALNWSSASDVENWSLY